jgi:hypothetical protein
MNPYDKGFAVRILSTLIFLLAIRKNTLNFNLFLPIALTALDGIDSYYSAVTPGWQNSFAYKIRDKIADSLSYFFVFMLFPMEIEYLWLVMYRILGVLLFGVTRKVEWLIAAPDLAKEFLLYKAVYGENMSVFPAVVILKVLFELYHHTVYDPLQR